MTYRSSHGSYLNPHAGGIFQRHRLSSATSLPSICVTTPEESLDFELHRQQIEAELEIITVETLASSKRSNGKYAAVTVPPSVKHQVSQAAEPNTDTASNMARPRSPQKKNEVDHEYLQGLLDEQLSIIRQRLDSLSSERAKMEQKMEDLTNGIKEACAQIPSTVILSQPGSVRRARSVESHRPNMIRTGSQHHMQKQFSETNVNPPLEEVDGEGLGSEQFVSTSSLGSSEHRDSDMNSLSGSMNSSSVFSASVSSLPAASVGRRYPTKCNRASSVSDYMDGHTSPTPIPELPESPGLSRPTTPHYYPTYSPRTRHRSNSSASPHSTFHSPKHSSSAQASPSHLPLARTSTSTPRLLSPPDSWSLSTSPRLPPKATRSSTDFRGRSSSSPIQKKKSSSHDIRQTPKDHQLSYFRKDSLTDDSGFKECALLVTDDECELRGSCDTLSEGSSPAEHDTPTKSSAFILRRSSLTGQIEHVTNLKTQVRRNTSLNMAAIDKLKKAPLKERRSLSVGQGRTKTVERTDDTLQASVTNTSTTSRKSSKVILLESKETTV